MCNGHDQETDAPQTQETDAAFGLMVKQIMECGKVWVVKVGSALEIGADADRPECGDGHGQPEASGTFWMVHLGQVPLPAAALVTLEPLLAPATQAVPGNCRVGRRQISEDKPGVLVAFSPPGKQCALQATEWAFEASATALPLTVGRAYQVLEPVPAGITRRPKLSAIVDTKKWMSVRSYYSAIEPGRIQPAVGQDNDRPLWRHNRTQQA